MVAIASIADVDTDINVHGYNEKVFYFKIKNNTTIW